MRTSYCFFSLLIVTFFVASTTFGQTVNFDETWKEFLENNKISNMSELVRPNKEYEKTDYAKYLLMNTNTSFCQSDVSDAERLLAEIEDMGTAVYQSIPGFLKKMDEVDQRIKAYYSMDAIWQRFLQTRDVTLEELDAVQAAKTSCEKSTLAKYSYMMAYKYLCQGNVPQSKDIFENRTLRLTEKTTLRVQDVKGLAQEVARMKSLYQEMADLDAVWNDYVRTGVSSGYNKELPVFPCYPVPTMKILILNGVLDLCNAAPDALAEIKRLQAESGVTLTGDLNKKVQELQAAVGQNESRRSALNKAWEAFLPDNRVRHLGEYGYEYCEKEPLIRAYIMDGFAYPCEMADEMLRKIDELQSVELTALEASTMRKINELAALTEKHQADAVKIERLWDKFIAQGDKLYENYQSADFYCDNIHQVKDWTMKGLSSSCEESTQYLEEIEAFRQNFDFKFTKDLECRIKKLQFKIWDCRYQALQKLARVEAPDAYEERLAELMQEYGMGERPEVCGIDE